MITNCVEKCLFKKFVFFSEVTRCAKTTFSGLLCSSQNVLLRRNNQTKCWDVQLKTFREKLPSAESPQRCGPYPLPLVAKKFSI